MNIEKQVVDFTNHIKLIGTTSFKLETPKSFVVFECIDKLLSMGYLPNEIAILNSDKYDIKCANLFIKCFE
ncbi:hypothetical protein J6P59_05865 [bacterium]|nr:hypothetical protein [bacterium]